MAFYQSSSFSDQDGYYYSQVPDQDYYYSYYPPTQSYGCYEYLSSQPLVAYSPCNGATYTVPASTDHYQYAVYHSEAAPSSPDVKFVEYDPQPYHGGYDIDQTYGKPLPPSDDICYPRSSFTPNPPFLSLPSPSPSPAPAPAPAPAPTPAPQQDDEEEELPPEFEEEEADDLKSESRVTEEVEQPSDDEDDDNDDGDGSEDGTSAGSVQVYQGAEEYNGRVVNQNPPGYGLEAFDLCENLFGYWPCMNKLKVNKRCDACGNENVVAADDVDQWKKTADYLFGNPDPYGGEWVDEGGYASGNPVNYAHHHHHQVQYQHHHQVQYQHPAYTLYQQQPDQSSHNPWSF